MFTFQLDNTRSKHCRHPLAVMGVVVYFRAQYYSNNTSHGRCKKNKILRWNGLTYIIETLEIPWAHRTWTICQKVWVKVCKSLRRRTTSNQLALPPAAHAELGTDLRSVCPFVVQSKLKAAELEFTAPSQSTWYCKSFWVNFSGHCAVVLNSKQSCPFTAITYQQFSSRILFYN